MDLMRPQRGEAPRYPTDTVIGSLSPGDVSDEACEFAREVLAAFVAETRDAPVLSAMNSVSREALFSSLKEIDPRRFRLGSGREEADGAVSFLVRFIGREQGIAGELYVRAGETENNEDSPWQFDDLILEEPLSLDERQEGPSFDLPPYERFF
ncbi:hypothetical protein FACS189479_00410 [Spirochaetia bacterium]|nr:hypothetical protein FACS189479_00410 [Spirochaetia bacterium]